MVNSVPFCVDQLWDWNMTWSNHRADPEFTECFQSTVVQCLGSMWLWFCCPVYLCLLLNYYRSDPLPSSWLSTARQNVLVMQLVVRLLQMKSTVEATVPNADGGGYWHAKFTGLTAECVTMVFVLALMELERSKHVVTSGVLSIYWLLTSLSAAAMVYSEYVTEADSRSTFFDTSLLRAWFGLAICQLALCFYTECPPTPSKTQKRMRSK